MTLVVFECMFLFSQRGMSTFYLSKGSESLFHPSDQVGLLSVNPLNPGECLCTAIPKANNHHLVYRMCWTEYILN